jgi:hypothetical protein
MRPRHFWYLVDVDVQISENMPTRPGKLSEDEVKRFKAMLEPDT